MTQPGQDPTLHDLHADLRLRFVLGLVGPGREDGHLIVLGQLLVTGVQFRVVPTGLADTAAQVVRHDHLRNAAEVLEGTHVTG